MTTTTNPLKETTSIWAKGHGPAAPKPLPADAVVAPPSPLPDLAALTDETLAALVEQGQAEIVRRKNKKETDFLAVVAETARTLGLSPARIAAALSNKSPRPRASGGTDGRQDVRPLLWNPLDHSQRWSKRGVKPQWYAEHLARGGTEEECRIPDGAV